MLFHINGIIISIINNINIIINSGISLITIIINVVIIILTNTIVSISIIMSILFIITIIIFIMLIKGGSRRGGGGGGGRGGGEVDQVFDDWLCAAFSCSASSRGLSSFLGRFYFFALYFMLDFLNIYYLIASLILPDCIM